MAYPMIYTTPAPRWRFPKYGMEAAALAFLRERCEGLRFDAEKTRREAEEGIFLGKSIGEGMIPYNMQMDVDRLCLENALGRFLGSGRKEDAFDVYFCYLEMFVGGYEKTRRMIELLSEYEANGSGLLMKHRDHYSHSVYVFALGLALFHRNAEFRAVYEDYYGFTDLNAAACHFLEFWGMTSLFHDIGYPFELPFEQVAAYFEVSGDERSDRPYVAYRALEQLTALDGAAADALAALYGREDARFQTTDELFAYDLADKLSGTYRFTRGQMLSFLQDKPTHPEKFSHFMDHAWFSATVLYKKLFCEIGCTLRKEHVDALTAILMHNSLYKFCIAHYKDEAVNVPFRAALHPLAWMLMLCDELQCWDRTAYGRDSRREMHPFGCRMALRSGALHATYVYDRAQTAKIEDFERRYAQWDGKGKAPKLKAYSGMCVRDGGVSDFQKDVERIVDLGTLRLQVDLTLDADTRKHGCLSDSNFINLYYFTLLIKGRGRIKNWKADPEGAFRALPASLAEVEAEFHKTSLEYRLDSIDRTRAFAESLERIGCFYSDKAVDFPPVKRFTKAQTALLGESEHRRWLQFRYDHGWRYGTDYVTDGVQDRGLRERTRRHLDLIPGYDAAAEPVVPEAAARRHYRALSKGTQDKDTEPMEYMLAMMQYMDGVRFYRLTEDHKTRQK